MRFSLEAGLGRVVTVVPPRVGLGGVMSRVSWTLVRLGVCLLMTPFYLSVFSHVRIVILVPLIMVLNNSVT